MAYRWSMALIVSILVLFLTFVLLYGSPAGRDVEVGAKDTMTPTVEISAVNEHSSVRALSPQDLTEMIDKSAEYSGADELFYNTLPLSLRDTPRPTALGVDEDEELIADHRVRNLFEYYLTAIGEESLDRIISRIQHDLSGQLEGVALDQANQILEGYLQYRNNMAVIKTQFVNQYGSQTYNLNVVKEMKSALRESRFGFLSEDVIIGFFEQEDQYDDYMMARVEVSSDSALSSDEKEHLISQLDQQSPQWIIEASQRANLVSNVRITEKQLRAEGATDDEIYAVREQAYGVDAAEKLRVLDEKRAQWRMLVDMYRVDLNSMIASVGGSSNINHELLNSLRSQYFEGPELSRIRAIDKVELGL